MPFRSRLLGSLVLVLAGAAALIPHRVSAGERVVDSLRPFVDRGQLAGAVVLVADKDRVLTIETIGFADIDAKTPMTPDSLF